MDLEARTLMGNPSDAWAREKLCAQMVLAPGRDAREGGPRDPDLEFLAKDNWGKYCVRQGKGK